MRGGEEDRGYVALGTRRNGSHRLALVASRDVVVDWLANDLLETLQQLPAGSELLLRRGRSTIPGVFEALTEAMAKVIGHRVTWCEPVGEGRAATFRRDFEMVERADQVIAYFSPDQVMVGGTGHVVEAALLRDIPVKGWEVTQNGLLRVGETDPPHGYNHTTEQMFGM